MQVEFTSLSRKGKSRIAQYGKIWNVVIVGKFQGIDALFIESLNRSSCRWVLLHNDPDFMHVEPDGKVVNS